VLAAKVTIALGRGAGLLSTTRRGVAALAWRSASTGGALGAGCTWWLTTSNVVSRLSSRNQAFVEGTLDVVMEVGTGSDIEVIFYRICQPRTKYPLLLQNAYLQYINSQYT
jgi:hypothetical protein